MMNRISNRLTARFVAIAAVLALVMAAPAVFAAEYIDYEENGTEPVATFSATDPDGDAIVWSLSGPDADLFTIGGGVLAFKKSPNYEGETDEGRDNIYNVTVNASGGSTDVIVTVTNVDEMGSVSIDDLQPQAGESVTATASDEDGDRDQERWQWSKSMSEDGAWEDISGATSPTYTPKAGDIGYYLRATATYSDGLGEGRDSASGVTAFAVEERPAANAAPAFADEDTEATGAQQERMVRETAKAGSSVGNPVTAADADNDPLLYELDSVTLAGADGTLGTDDDVTTVTVTGAGPDGDFAATGDNTTTEVDAKTLFAINNKTGQISLKSDADLKLLNIEANATTLADTTATPPVAQELAYSVVVTAEDPSGATGTVTVKIVVAAVNEAPEIKLADDGLGDTITQTTEGGEFNVRTPEQDPLDLDPEGDTRDDFATGLPVFYAVDPEGAAESAISWSISGDDAKRFEIRKGTISQLTTDPTPPAEADSVAALRWAAGDGPSFEDMDSADGDNVYKVTVTVFDGTASESQVVNITVTNKEEAGKITLSQRVPQQGRAITARLSDEDGGMRDVSWQWYRGNGTLGVSDANGTVVIIADGTLTETVVLTPGGYLRTIVADGDDTFAYVTGGTAVTECVLETGTPTDTCAIKGATSSTYTPTAEDAAAGLVLQARATYVDAFVTDVLPASTGADDPAGDGTDDGDAASVVSDGIAIARPDANAAPTFGDDESVDRSVAENAKGALVGDPVTASDSDEAPRNLLQYELSGDGSDSFSVSDDGQITTAKALDYETQSSYSLTLTATDPSGASDSITVNITVTDADDPAVISATASVSYEENGTGPVATFTATDADGDAIVWSLSGPDADLFTIEGGVLAFKKSPNYEGETDEGRDNIYNVTVNASGGSTDVVVTVTNVDEMGSVSIDDLQPQAGESVTATASDQDGDRDQERWQWSKSMSEDGGWEDISGATSPTYTPKAGDVGYYLRATATYSDGLGEGRDSASGVTAFAVEARPVANAAPAFADEDTEATGAQQERMVRETAKAGSSVGNPVTAADADNDPLLYKLVGVKDAAGPDGTGAPDGTNDFYTTHPAQTDGGPTTGVVAVDPDALFEIDKKTGQISLKSGADVALLNVEAYATTNAAPTADPPVAQELAYTVTVTAEDPSGATGTVTVKIVVAAVNEAPDIKLATTGLAAVIPQITEGGEFNVRTPEQDPLDLDPEGDTRDEFATGLPVFNAFDPENAAETAISWSISGDDARRFEIRKGTLPDPNPDGIDSTAALRWADGDGPSFEDMDSADGDNVYKVTVTVFDGTASESQVVNITVTNKEEAGKITLSQRVPQQGRAITARLSDEDGGMRDVSWQWYRGNGTLGVSDANGTVVIVDPTTLGATLRLSPAGHAETLDATTGAVTGIAFATGTAVTNCVLTPQQVTDGVTVSATCAINGATSSTYTPTAEDATAGLVLQARVTYVDAFVTDALPVNGTFDGADGRAETDPNDGNGTDDGDTASVVSDGIAIARPDANAAPTFGDDESVDRSVAENAKGALVGDPVTASDSDEAPRNLLQYKLSGDGSDSFSVSDDGQITTAKALDYETQSSYSLTLTATDPSGASDSITVNITVTDADDGATVILLTGNAPEFDSEEMTRSVAENTAAGMAIGDPVAATDVDGDTLTYTLGGDDAMYFTIDSMGQLMTSAALDYEMRMSYMVTVTASSGKADEVDAMTTVTIMVTDEGLDNAYDLNENGAIERDEVIAAIQDYLGGNTSRSEVTELIRLYFGEDG